MVTDRGPVNVSLFEAADLDEMPKVRNMTVSAVSSAEVDEFCRRYHYSGHKGSASWRWGLWNGATLLGVVAYNLPTRSVCGSLFGAEGIERVWHMGRLVCAPEAPHNSESRLIGGSLRAIAATRPDVWAVITYAATSEGHLGYVYQATNALYTGTSAPIATNAGYVDQFGRQRSPVNGGDWITRADAESRGWTALPLMPKHRYIYLLGDRKQRRRLRADLRYPVLPYPKREEVAA